jgi:glucose/arabinose dehydrogenase
MIHRRFLLPALPLILAATASAQQLNDTRLRIDKWASGLKSPTQFAWVGPEEMLVFEKDTGKVRRVKAGTVRNVALDLNVDTSSERGGLGIALDPDFANNQYVYLYYSLSSGSSDTSGQWSENRVERYTFDGRNLGQVYGPLISFAQDSGQGGNGPNHDGGVIRIGPDGKLYGVTGDLNRGRMGGTARIEQNTATSGSARVGGVFRINLDGTIPSDNPFINESDANLHLWWSYGLRNSYGMTFDPLNDNLWYTENGPDKYDEINRCPKGMNGGWLLIMGPDSRNAAYSENNNTSYDASQLVSLSGSTYVDPEFSFKTPIGITAIEFLHSKRFPVDLRDNVYVGDNNNGNIYYFAMKASRSAFVLKGSVADKVADNGTEVGKVLAGNGFSVITDMHLGADGYLYLTNLGTGVINRIRPVVDLVETNDFAVDAGVFAAGEVADLEESDDVSVRLAPAAASRQPDTILASATFHLNELLPKSVTLDVESHCDGSVDQQILVHNVVTGAWDELDLRRLTHVDRHHTLKLANPADYVRAADKVVELRLIAKSVVGGSGSTGDATQVGGSGGHTVSAPGLPTTGARPLRPLFHLWIDQLRMNVEYP